MATEQDRITIEAHEVGGLADFVRLQLNCAGEEFHAAEDRRAYLDYMRDLLDIQEALEAAHGGSVTLRRGDTLMRLIWEGSAESPERLGEALTGRYPDDTETVIREAGGLMSLGRRLGVYEGVTV